MKSSRLSAFCMVLMLVVSCWGTVSFSQSDLLLIQKPTVSETQLVFALAGDSDGLVDTIYNNVEIFFVESQHRGVVGQEMRVCTRTAVRVGAADHDVCICIERRVT